MYAILHPENSPELTSLSKAEVFSALVAALCHDAGHNGCNNAFHVNCGIAGATGDDVEEIYGCNIA